MSSNIDTRRMIIVRHGQADHNLNSSYNSDPSHRNYTASHLTDLGKKQAEATALAILSQGYRDTNIDAIYISPLPRTRETAAIIASILKISEHKIIIDQRIIEAHAGDREGISGHSFENNSIDLSWAKDHGAEDWTDIARRVESLLHSIQDIEQSVIFVTHGYPSISLLKCVHEEEKRLKPGEFAILDFPKH